MRDLVSILAAWLFSAFLKPILCAAGGAAAAHLIALVADNPIDQTLVAFSLLQHPLEAWQLGATLGFLAGFLPERAK